MSTLLGKSLPHTRGRSSNRLTSLLRRVTWGYTLSLLIAVGILVSHTPFFPSTPSVPSLASFQNIAPRVFADFGPYNQLSADLNALNGTDGSTTLCNVNDYNSTFNVKTIFPILPSSILTSPKCSPPYWNLRIFRVLLYKVLGLLNYLVEIAAIILTIYAGILYLSGFANEGNVKTAKTMLVSVYVGLIISLSATLILRSTIGVFADSNSKDVICKNQQVIFNGSGNDTCGAVPVESKNPAK